MKSVWRTHRSHRFPSSLRQSKLFVVLICPQVCCSVLWTKETNGSMKDKFTIVQSLLMKTSILIFQGSWRISYHCYIVSGYTNERNKVPPSHNISSCSFCWAWWVLHTFYVLSQTDPILDDSTCLFGKSWLIFPSYSSSQTWK